MEDGKKCPHCLEGTLTSTKTHYHFRACGLSNVCLADVEVSVCDRCGERMVALPDPVGLMRVIGEAIILKRGRLSGEEIRFLRKNLTMKINEFAEYIGVTRQAVSRWENGRDKPNKVADRFIRAFYAQKARLSQEIQEEMLELFKVKSETLNSSYSWHCRLSPRPYCELHESA